MSAQDPQKNFLFLTTEQPEVVGAVTFLQNWTLPALLRAEGATVTIKCWRDHDIFESLQCVDLVSFLWCYNYHDHSSQFLSFLDRLTAAAKSWECGPRVVNHPAVLRWNADKRYLLEMEKAGFQIPRTTILEAEKYSLSELRAVIHDFKSSGPVILKPSMSSSSQMTRHVKNVADLTDEDTQFLELCISGKMQSSLVLQNFEESIAAGEFSFVFIRGKLTKIVLKTPKSGEFRCQIEFEGTETQFQPNDIPEKTWASILEVLKYLDVKFNSGGTRKMEYLRVDGLVTDERPFVLMEIEAIEPHLWLETGCGVDELLEIFFPDLEPSRAHD
jgi:glutathione synthase/RimK-type ligase-like ATP-grasp enzyme